MHRIAALALALAVLALSQPSPAQSDTASPAASKRTAASSEDAVSADAVDTLRRRLIGEWVEVNASRNHVDFFADGRVSLYLKKGEIGDLKRLEGTWTLNDANALTVEFTANQQTIAQSATLSFEGDEMLLTDDSDDVTRHRRREGALPAEYRW